MEAITQAVSQSLTSEQIGQCLAFVTATVARNKQKAKCKNVWRQVISYLKAREYPVVKWLDWCCPQVSSRQQYTTTWDKIQPDDDVGLFHAIIMPFDPDNYADLVMEFNESLQPLAVETLFSSGTEVSDSIFKPEVDSKMASLAPLSRRIYDTYCADYIKAINKEYSTQVVSACMGTGKTTAVLKYIKDNKVKYSVFITCRESMANDLRTRINSENIPVVHYKEMQDINLKTFEGILVIQLESIHKINKGTEFTPPNMVIIDEATSICEQFDSKTMCDKFHKNVAAFVRVVKYSDQCVAMDAHIDERIFIVLESLRDGPIHVQENDKLPRENWDAYNFKHMGRITFNLIEDLREGQRLFVTSATKEHTKTLCHYILSSLPNKKVLVHHSDNRYDEENQIVLNDIRQWANYDCVIISPTITNGVDFNLEHFDREYSFISARGPNADNLSQMLGRVRKVRTQSIYYHIDHQNGHRSVNINAIKYMDDMYHQYSVKLRDECDVEVDKDDQTKRNQINDYIYEMQRNMSEEVYDPVRRKVFTQRKRHWLYEISCINRQVRNKSWNNITEEFEATLTRQGIQIDYISDEDKDNLKADDKVVEDMKRVSELVKAETEKAYSLIPLVSESEAEEARIRRDAGVGTTADHQKVDKYDLCRHFKDPPVEDYETYKKLKGTLNHYKLASKAQHCTLRELVIYDNNADKHPDTSVCVQLHAVNVFKSFFGFQDKQLWEIDKFNTNPMRLRPEEACNMMTGLIVAFKMNLPIPFRMSDVDNDDEGGTGGGSGSGKTKRPTKTFITFNRMFEAMLGFSISTGKKGGKTPTINHKRYNLQEYVVVPSPIFMEWYPKFIYDEQIARIKLYSQRRLTDISDEDILESLGLS